MSCSLSGVAGSVIVNDRMLVEPGLVVHVCAGWVDCCRLLD